MLSLNDVVRNGLEAHDVVKNGLEAQVDESGRRLKEG